MNSLRMLACALLVAAVSVAAQAEGDAMQVDTVTVIGTAQSAATPVAGTSYPTPTVRAEDPGEPQGDVYAPVVAAPAGAGSQQAQPPPAVNAPRQPQRQETSGFKWWWLLAAGIATIVVVSL